MKQLRTWGELTCGKCTGQTYFLDQGIEHEYFFHGRVEKSQRGHSTCGAGSEPSSSIPTKKSALKKPSNRRHLHWGWDGWWWVIRRERKWSRRVSVSRYNNSSKTRTRSQVSTYPIPIHTTIQYTVSPLGQKIAPTNETPASVEKDSYLIITWSGINCNILSCGMEAAGGEPDRPIIPCIVKNSLGRRNW
jgi:hypothetical protein